MLTIIVILLLIITLLLISIINNLGLLNEKIPDKDENLGKTYSKGGINAIRD